MFWNVGKGSFYVFVEGLGVVQFKFINCYGYRCLFVIIFISTFIVKIFEMKVSVFQNSFVRQEKVYFFWFL